MIRKFKIIATRTDEYVIEIDESIYNEEWRKEYAEVFHQLEDLEEIAKDLAFHQLRFGELRFIEGYGNVHRNGTFRYNNSDFDLNGKLLPVEKRDLPAKGLNIIIKSEDEEYEFNVEEVTP